MRFYNDLRAKSWIIPHEEDPTGDPPPADPPAGDQPPTDKTFTQAQLDAIVKERVAKERKNSKSMIDELEALKAKSKLTSNERRELEERIETMKNQHLTKEELAEKERNKIERTYKADLDAATQERDAWKLRFTGSTITRSLTDAAVENDAFSPEQIVALLLSNTTLVEDLDEDGKPTGELKPIVKFRDNDKEGKAVTLDLEPKVAVKRMTEIDRYLNLFKGKGAGGLGGNNSNAGSGKEPTANDLAKDPKAYREARKTGKLDFA